MENEQLFEFMSKMYSEMKDGFKRTDERFDGVENRLIKIEVTLENDIKPKIDMLFEGHALHTEKLNEIDTRLERIEQVVVEHDVLLSKSIK